MFFRSVILSGVILPVVVCGTVLALAWRPWRRFSPTGNPLADGLWGGALGIGAGYLAAHAAIVGWPALPPVGSTQRLFYLIAGATLLGVLRATWEAPAALRWGLRLLPIAALLGLTLRPMVEHQWQRAEATVWIPGLGLGVVLVWLGLEGLAARHPGFPLTLSLVGVSASAGAVLGMSGSALLGQLGGALAGALTAAALFAWWTSHPTLERGAAQVVAMALLGLVLTGYFFAELRATSALLLALGPLAAWICEAGPVKQLKPKTKAIVTFGAVLLLMAPAIALALMEFLSQEEPYY